MKGWHLCSRTSCAAALLFISSAFASPFVPPGDVALRADVQTLADHGVIAGPVTSWPLAWAPILADIDENLSATEPGLPEYVLRAATRVRERSRTETGAGVRYRAELALAEEPRAIRSFADTPRESGQLGAGLSWTGNRLYADLNAQARPIPSLTVDHVFTQPFESAWLSWLGAWDFTMTFGRLESDRAVSDAQHFGLRFAFRPLTSLEVGLSRAAQWCGDGRPAISKPSAIC